MDPLEADDPRVIGGFRLQARLGAGGMGRVYLGFSPAGRAVAVKVIHPHLARDPSFASRFRREVAAAQAVNAVYAAPVVAAGADDAPPWLATAFVPAPSLQEVIATAGPLPEDAVWKLAAGLAEALRAVHASGLVHRDLKPGNVLLAADGPRLIDFGIAQLVDGTRLTTTGGVLGTPSYMSPEQARGDTIGPPSDVFSLGGVVCFAATGRTPFGGGAPTALLYRIVFDEPDLDGLSPQLRSLVGACLDKNPAARPTPAQLATALMPAIPGGAPFTPSRVAFWPEPVERFISDYRARLDAGPVAGTGQVPQTPAPWQAPGGQAPSNGWQAPSGWQASGGWQPAGEPTVGRLTAGGVPVPGVTTNRQPGTGRHALATAPVAGMNRRRALAALAGAVTAGVGIAGWEVAARAGTGKPAARPFSLPKVAPGKVAWRFNANATVASVAQAGNVVYAATNGNTVFAVNATTGKQIWKRTVTSELNEDLVVAGGSVVVSGGNGPYALAATGGNQLWSVKSDSAYPMLAAGGVVYVAFAAKNDLASGVTALDPATGTIVWTLAFGENDGIAGMLALADGVLYTTTTAGEAFAISAKNGAQRQRIGGFGAFGSSPIAAADGVVYAGLDDKKGTVVAVDTAAGKTLWRQSLGAATFGPSVAAANGIVFAGTVDGGALASQTGKLFALSAKTGKPLWSVPVAGGANEGPVVAGDVVYTGSGALASGTLVAWELTTGRKAWSFTAPDAMGDITAVPGSRVFFGSGGYVYSVGA
ncbi:MAG TPA: PQQ-binding-like beta-propeller repeat protein [Trebonia sp.]|nr:PQQ-binding-like beta-propeller repeat protein [Trebonia sp.]